MGNVGSIANMLKRIGFATVITSDPTQIEAGRQAGPPGVGAFDTDTTNLARTLTCRRPLRVQPMFRHDDVASDIVEQLEERVPSAPCFTVTHTEEFHWVLKNGFATG